MLEVIDDLARLPVGSHAVGFYASQEEAADQAVSFLAGTPPGQSASFWVADSSLVAYYNAKLEERAPEQVGCVHVLEHEQVRPEGDHLRPVSEVLDFVGEHPEGVTAAGDTITQYWAPQNVPDHMEYEAWFQEQPRDQSRFLCPYDLRRVPPDQVQAALEELGKHHTHAVLSSSDEPAVRLMQLFVFGMRAAVPAKLRRTADWAQRKGLIKINASSNEMRLTPKGEREIVDWETRSRTDLAFAGRLDFPSGESVPGSNH